MLSHLSFHLFLFLDEHRSWAKDTGVFGNIMVWLEGHRLPTTSCSSLPVLESLLVSFEAGLPGFSIDANPLQ